MPEENNTNETKKIKSEFLIFKIDQNPKIGNTYKFLGLATTEKKAVELVNKLSSNETGRMVILEKKAYLERKPVMAVNNLEENIIN